MEFEKAESESLIFSDLKVGDVFTWEHGVDYAIKDTDPVFFTFLTGPNAGRYASTIHDDTPVTVVKCKLIIE